MGFGTDKANLIAFAGKETRSLLGFYWALNHDESYNYGCLNFIASINIVIDCTQLIMINIELICYQ